MVNKMDKEILEGLSYNEKRLLLAMDAAGGTSTPEELVAKGAFSLEVEAMGSASWLSTKGLMGIEEEQSVFYVLADEDIAKTGLAERRAIEFIDKAGGRMDMSALAEAKAVHLASCGHGRSAHPSCSLEEITTIHVCFHMATTFREE